MATLFHHRLAARRLRSLLWAMGAVAVGVSLLGNSLVQAQELPLEFASFQRAPQAEARTFVSPDQWERVSRPADRFGPRPLRPVDRQLLDAARSAQWPQVLELLSKQGADPEATDLRRTHVLVLAARSGQIEVVRELLRRGADIGRRSDDGFTALGAAAFHGHAHLVTQLLKAGADASEAGVTGQTALHLAALAGRSAVVSRLLQQGVPVDILNTRRETALDLAAQTGQVAVLDQLVAAGADMTRAGNR